MLILRAAKTAMDQKSWANVPGAINKKPQPSCVFQPARTKPFQRQITMQIERRAIQKCARGPEDYLFGPPRRAVIFHIYLAAAISHSVRYTKNTLMHVSPSCLFIKNGFLSFLSLSAV